MGCSFKDIINPYNCLLKNEIFQSKQAMKKKNHLSLNSQFIVVLDDIVCFSVRFGKKFTISAKNAFSGVFLQAKRYKGVPVTGKY